MHLPSHCAPTPIPRSIENNRIGAEGASALAAILKETMISNLECAAAQWCSLLCQRPLTQMRTVSLPSLASPPPPVVSEGEHVPFPEHIPCFGPLTFPHSQTHTHAPLPISTPTRCRPPLCAAWTAATSSCRTAGSRVLPRPSQPPCDPPRHSLQYSGLDDKAQQVLRDAAGSGVSITF